MAQMQLSEISIMRRINCLRHYAGKRRINDVFWLKKQTDRERIHVQISAGYSLITYFALTSWITRSTYFNPESNVFFGWIAPCVMIIFCVWLMYWTFKLKWACKVFDLFGADMVSDIETRIAEQAAPSNR